MPLRPLLIACAAVIAAGCAGDDARVCGGSDGIVAADAWVRAASAEQTMSAAYVELCNGGAADRLIRVRFDDADAVELHNTIISEDGVASMRPAAAGISLPAKETVALKPGGAHIMLIGLDRPLEAGEEVAMTLAFESAPPLTLTFEIRDRTEVTGH